jgi:hypothetical protein
MRSHFTLSSRSIEFVPPSAKKTNRGSHFKIGSRAVIACAVTGTTAMLTGICSAQVAADSASNPTYAAGWSAGQNGGYGFGAWSFDGTVSPGGLANPGAQQEMSSSSPLGTAWTMFNLGTAPPSGISDVGRAITEPGGLQVGQSFETVIENPVGYNFYGGFDILFTDGTDNNAAGNNAAAIRVSEFNYYTSYPDWNVNDANTGTTTPLSSLTTAVSGMELDLTLTSATAYSLTLTPLSDPGDAYTQTGTYAGPIDYVNYRLYDGASSGPTDTADNFEISNMQIVPDASSTAALLGLVSAGLLYLRGRK